LKGGLHGVPPRSRCVRVDVEDSFEHFAAAAAAGFGTRPHAPHTTSELA
jgi:hypothetical protein